MGALRSAVGAPLLYWQGLTSPAAEGHWKRQTNQAQGQERAGTLAVLFWSLLGPLVMRGHGLAFVGHPQLRPLPYLDNLGQVTDEVRTAVLLA
ncbi:hypothetical protein [Mycobacterium bourgelatii]|uniref:hypothetical protein n=1 Tax=Mycobacterium bourgelatii TaxID=1273442 RepID=UPI0013CF779A|nr:hypothetical protein [Mycobacterium bourgelatii]MCV6974446.1 hypothetical protein [Mycobacterium bourgelatii]